MRHLLFLLIFLTCAPLSAQGSQQRPNIIFILTDDQRYDALGHAGNPLSETPEMDRLAREGAYFRQAMVTTPICAASRASILSGRYERAHRFDFSAGGVSDTHMADAYPLLLKRAGYRTGFFGKYGVRYDEARLQFDEIETYDRNNAYADERGYFYKTLGGDTVHLTRYTGQRGLDFIAGAADSDQPFYLALNFSAPHAHDAAPDQYFWQPEQDALLAGTTVPPPALGEDRFFDVLPQPVRDGFNRLRWTWRYDTPEKYQHSVKGYHRMIGGIDREIGKIREELTRRGLAENTVILLLGDNGYFLGERQLAGKWLLYDNSVRVPLIVYDPRQKTSVDSDAMALNIDIPPTLTALAGVAAPAGWHGQSLLPVVEGRGQLSGRDTVLLEHLWQFDRIPPSEGVRTREWKYFRYRDDLGVEELYHLGEDPRETENLAADPAHAATLRELRRKTDELATRYGDDEGAAPTGLSVEYLRQPAGLPLVDDRPEFGWEVPAAARFQRGYQLLVATSPEVLARNVGDVWNSGRVTSNASVNVPYDGPDLQPGRTYHWKVRLFDAQNRLSRYSAAQTFTTRPATAPDGYSTTANRWQLDRIAPVGLETKDDVLHLDFGRAAFANMALTYTARRDHELTVRLGELRKDGRVDPEPGGTIRYQEVRLPVRRGTHTYTLPLTPDKRNTLPMAVQMPDSLPLLLPYRYAEIEGARSPIGRGDVVQLAYHDYWDDGTSYFESSDTILNQVWDLCRYSIKATTFAGLYVDGDRERIPYEADAYLNQLSHYTTDREYAIARRTIEYFMEHPTWPTEWQQHVALMFWADYEYTGNLELIERYYEPLKYKTLLELKGPDGLVSSTRATPEFMRKLGFKDPEAQLKDITDWPPAQKDTNWKLATEEGERDGFVFRPNNTVINAFFVRNMQIMADFARLLGKYDEETGFRLAALEATRAINDKLLDRERGVYVDGEGTEHASVHANMLPLAFGIVPPDYVESVADFVKSRGMAASVYGAQYLLDGLYEAGRDDYALDLMTRTDDRSWYNMIRSGSTITMEAWDLKYKPNLDLNHAWGAVPANVIPRRLWGIRPLEPGFGVALIAPQLGSLRSSRIGVPTLRGTIHARYERQNARRQVFEIDIPGNMVAVFRPQVEGERQLTVNGEPANPGFGDVRLEPGHHRIELTINSF